MKKKALRRQIRALEQENQDLSFALFEQAIRPPVIKTLVVHLGDTGTPVERLSFPILMHPDAELPDINLPAIGYEVRKANGNDH